MQVPGAERIGRPLTSFIASPINLQHLQLACNLHGVVFPSFFPNAIDFTTDNIFPMLGPVFFTNWNNGLLESLTELVWRIAIKILVQKIFNVRKKALDTF